jgi:plastocyanin
MTKKKRGKQHRKGFLGSRTFIGACTVGLLLITAGAAFLAFRGGDDAPRRSLRQDPVVTNEMDVTIDVVDRDYEPRDLTVPVGATVTWRFMGDLPHDVTDDRGAFGSPTLQKGDEWSLTVEEAATYYYYCTIHHSM